MKENIFYASTLSELKNSFGHFPVIVFNSTPDLGVLSEVAALCGGLMDNDVFGKIRNLTVDNETLNFSVGSSDNAHPPHTDGVYNQELITSFLLQCVTEDKNGGGKGLFWSIPDFFTDIPIKYRDFLSLDQFYYSRRREDGIIVDRFEGPIIFEYDGKPSFRWRYDLQVRPRLKCNHTKEKDKLFHDSVTWILTYFLENPPLVLNYSTGDIVICDNLHMVHGRTKILSPNRFFRRAWLNFL